MDPLVALAFSLFVIVAVLILLLFLQHKSIMRGTELAHRARYFEGDRWHKSLHESEVRYKDLFEAHQALLQSYCRMEGKVWIPPTPISKPDPPPAPRAFANKPAPPVITVNTTKKGDRI